MSSSDTAIRVLLVDDDPAFRRVMGAELARRGYAVETRASGQEALDPAASAEVDVILLDLRLPRHGRPRGARGAAPPLGRRRGSSC